ncbi:MAG: alpha/beta hydrolase [Betaproteobacteria bacterium]|jgi:pimeloyl-ACP methyl ester carboxylesterase|nr:alpha/beta hydrolase [Betaproteobacteria bacterium]
MPYLELPDAKIFYQSRGDGEPPIVFVHGALCSHEDWNPQFEHFGARQRVVACELRGHGKSPVADPDSCSIEAFASDVVALMRALDLPPAVLVGHSMGCRVVLEANLQAPDRVAGLVLNDGGRLGQGDPEAAERKLRAEMAAAYEKVMGALFAGMFNEKSDPELRDRLVRRALAIPQAVGLAFFPRMIAWDAGRLEEALASVRVPTLVLQSTFTNAQRVRVSLEPRADNYWFEVVREHAPSARIQIVPGIGHFTMLEAPEQTIRAIAGLLELVPKLRRSER